MIDERLKQALISQHQEKFKQYEESVITKKKLLSGDYITHYSSGKPVQEGDIPLCIDTVTYENGHVDGFHDMGKIFLRIDEIDYYSRIFSLYYYDTEYYFVYAYPNQ